MKRHIVWAGRKTFWLIQLLINVAYIDQANNTARALKDHLKNGVIEDLDAIQCSFSQHFDSVIE